MSVAFLPILTTKMLAANPHNWLEIEEGDSWDARLSMLKLVKFWANQDELREKLP